MNCKICGEDKFSTWVFLSSEDGSISKLRLLLVLQDDLAHTEVEESADVEDEEEGADDRESKDWGPGWAGVCLRDRVKQLLGSAWPAHCI